MNMQDSPTPSKEQTWEIWALKKEKSASKSDS
jgi:hypothetical protein